MTAHVLCASLSLAGIASEIIRLCRLATALPLPLQQLPQPHRFRALAKLRFLDGLRRGAVRLKFLGDNMVKLDKISTVP